MRSLRMVLSTLFVVAAAIQPAAALEPIPDRLVVLTFDDSVKSHFTVVRPILKQYGFGATFFITEGFDFKTDKQNYMTWDEIAQLHRDGFEIGNHTRDHLNISDANAAKLIEQLKGIDDQCRAHKIPPPTSFAWPGNSFSMTALEKMRTHGIQFARRGGAPEYPYKEGRGFAYEPGLDHPLLIPSAGDARPDWTIESFRRAVELARPGRIAVLQFHGVPDRAHAWVNTDPDRFAGFMKLLAVEKYQVIALRDLARYVDPQVVPQNPQGAIEDRQAALKNGTSRENSRRPATPQELQRWLSNMREHQFSPYEMSAATGLAPGKIRDALARLPKADPVGDRDQLRVLPYPGGRHPRTGFRDGAIRPQRETKVSIFAPWKDGGYFVADVPEAIWMQSGEQRKLLYLAHTHVPTMWSEQNVQLPPLEWKARAEGGWEMERTLPNRVRFGTRVMPSREGVRMEMWLHNGTDQLLRGLRVQNCVMLSQATGFGAQTGDNKLYRGPLAACHNEDRSRWVITAWVPNQRSWGNVHCPCLHSDPQFPDCPPGETQHLRGWVSFYEGQAIDEELDRVAALPWLRDKDESP